MMDRRRKRALLALLTITFLFSAVLTVITAWKTLCNGYVAGGEEVSLVATLAFVSYALAEAIFFLRTKFEGEKSSNRARKTVLIYLLMLLLFILIGIIYFGSTIDETTLRGGYSYSLPPEDEYVPSSPQTYIDDNEITASEEETVIGEKIEKEIEGKEESTASSSIAAEELQEAIEDAEIVSKEKDISDSDESIGASTESAEEEISDEIDQMNEGEGLSEMDEVRVPTSASISVSLKTLIESEPKEIIVPSSPTFNETISQEIKEVKTREEEEADFWASFYIAGEDELELADGIYYMDLYINDNEVGSITVNIANGEVFLLSDELSLYVGETVTEEFYERMFSTGTEYISLNYIENLGIRTSYDSTLYEIRLNFSADAMPIQILSIGGTSGFRRSVRPITGAAELKPAVFTLTSSYYFNARVRDFLSDDILSGLSFSFSSTNTARLYDLYLDFNYYMNFSSRYFTFNLGTYRFYYDFPDEMIRLSFGNVSSDLFSPSGTSIGIRFDKNYTYAKSNYRRPSQIEEIIIVDKPSEIQIFNEGREIYRRNLDVGTYRLRDFILYSGANKITIILSPLDGSEEKIIEFDVLYSASLLAPGEIYYGASLVTSRSIVSSSSQMNGMFRFPIQGGRSVEYDLRDIVFSSYVRAGLSRTLSMDATFAFQNDPTNVAAFRPNMKLALEFTHANILGTTRYGLNITERTESDSSWNIPGIYANIGHQIRTGWSWLSTISLSANYSSPEETRVENRHRFGLSASLSGRIGLASWSLSGSGGIYTDEIENSYWNAAASISLTTSRNFWLNGSINVSQTGDTNARVYGRVYATLRYDGGSTNVSFSNNESSITSRYNTGNHSIYASVDTNDLLDFNAYDFNAEYGYSGRYFNFDVGINSDETFSRLGADISLRTASVFADGLLTFRSYIPSNYVLISQKGALKGNTVSVGSSNSSYMREIPSLFGISMYDGISSTYGDSFIVYSQNEDGFSRMESFPVNVPVSNRRGYVLRLDADNTFASSGVVVLPNGDPWINGSSPIYKVIDADGQIILENTEYYLFTDIEGRFVTSSMEVGEYAFDVPYNDGWILVRFEILDRPEDLGMLQLLNSSNIKESTIYNDIYSFEMNMTFDQVISEDDFFNMIYQEVAL